MLQQFFDVIRDPIPGVILSERDDMESIHGFVLVRDVAVHFQLECHVSPLAVPNDCCSSTPSTKAPQISAQSAAKRPASQFSSIHGVRLQLCERLPHTHVFDDGVVCPEVFDDCRTLCAVLLTLQSLFAGDGLVQDLQGVNLDNALLAASQYTCSHRECYTMPTFPEAPVYTSSILPYVPVDQLTAAIVRQYGNSGSAKVRCVWNVPAVRSSFVKLDRNCLGIIMSMLPFSDFLRFRSLDRQLYTASKQNMIWAPLYNARFSVLPWNDVSHWHHAYAVRCQGVSSEFRCSLTGRSLVFDNSLVLGFPLIYTSNPRTNRVDYIEVQRELVCADCSEPILPVFIHQQHFERSVPHLLASAKRMWPKLPENEASINMLSVVLNTIQLQLSDKAIPTVAAIRSYCQVLKSFQALCELVPTIQQLVETRLKRFMTVDRNRSKLLCRSLGTLMPLFAVSKVYDWKRCWSAVLRESFARSVLWQCRHYPQLADVDSSMDAKRRARLSWDSTIVAKRKTMINVLLSKIKPENALYGEPSSTQLKSMASAIEELFRKECYWPQYFKIVANCSPSLSKVNDLLRGAVSDSLRRGYHSKLTKFQKIHANGSSKLLRKGESYATANDVEEVELTLAWHFPNGIIYLDATALCYSEAGVLLGVCDYNTRWTNSSIRHSGDQIDNQLNRGEHNIRIQLKRLHSKVHTIYFALSAWTGTLSGVFNPSISMVDSVNPELQLCSYSLESAGDHQAVVMARLVRAETAMGGWSVKPCGFTCDGTAREYSPVIDAIAASRQQSTE